MTTNNAVNVGLSGATGTGSFVGSTSPTLVTPALGTPASGTLTNCTGLPISSGVSGLGTGVATGLGNSATGSGSPVLSTSPTLTTPALGTPSSGTLTSCTGLPISTGVSGLGTGVATALASNVTGSGSPVLATSPTLTTPTLGAASATSLAFSSTSGIIGTTTNNDSAAGSVGEFITANVSSSSTVPVTTVAIDLTSISLTAGDWDVWGNVGAHANATYTTVNQNVDASISTTSATLPADTSSHGAFSFTSITANNYFGFNVPMVRLSLSGTTTVYLCVQNIFATNQMNCCGNLSARRVR